MAEIDAPKDLKDMIAGHLGGQASRVLLQLVENRVVDVLEDEEELAPPPEDLDQIYQVLVAETLWLRTRKRRENSSYTTGPTRKRGFTLWIEVSNSSNGLMRPY